MDLESLDLKDVDKEMVTDEASQSTATAPEGNALEPIRAGDDKAAA